jgi:Flp pilus assembly protein TadG
MVEFAIVLPVLLLFILGILYFGRFEDYANQSTQLAEQGARSASVNFDPPGSTTLQQYILAQAQPELANGSNDVTPAQAWVYQPTTVPVQTWAVGQQVRVCVTFKMTFPTPVGTPATTVTKSATMRLEQVAAANPYSSGNVGAIPATCPTS